MRQYRVYIGETDVEADEAQYAIRTFAKKVEEEYGGFSMSLVTGSWHGEHENALLFEVITDKDSASLFAAVKGAKEALKQEAVLVTTAEVEATFI